MNVNNNNNNNNENIFENVTYIMLKSFIILFFSLEFMYGCFSLSSFY